MSDAGSSGGKSSGAKRSDDARGSDGIHETDSWAGAGHSASTHDRLGRAISDLLENPLVTGAIGRAWGAREKAAQAQELWMGALNLPSSADIERLTRRLRSVSQRLEGVEDGVQRLGRSLVEGTGIETRLGAIEDGLGAIAEELGQLRELVGRSAPADSAARTSASRGSSGSRSRSGSRTSSRAKRPPSSAAKAKKS
jgi:hypothetical protein